MQKQRKAIAEAFGSALRAIEKGFGSERDGLDPGATVRSLLPVFVLVCLRALGTSCAASTRQSESTKDVSNRPINDPSYH